MQALEERGLVLTGQFVLPGTNYFPAAGAEEAGDAADRGLGAGGFI